MRADKIIVAVAPVGARAGDANPTSAEDVARATVACADAGASMVHLHVRDDQGEQTFELSTFSRTLGMIRERSDIILQGSTGGLTTLTLEQRCVALEDPRVEVASLNMGSTNFGENVYINTVPDIRYWASRMRAAHVLPELAIFGHAMIPSALNLVQEGVLQQPLHFNIALGFPNAAPAEPRMLCSMVSLLPEGSWWGMLHDDMEDFAMLAMAAGMGARIVRVGFEDGLHYKRGVAASTNAELVERLVRMLRSIGLEIATPAEARTMLGLALVPKGSR